MMARETWLPVVGYEDRYIVSDHGRVFSLRAGVMLAPCVNKGGYQQVSLTDGTTKTSLLVHRLVLEAFVGPCPEGQEALHGAAGQDINTPENLRWGTRTENNRDLILHGTHHYVRRTHCKNGHEYTPENTFYRKDRTGRHCRECHRINGRRARRKFDHVTTGGLGE